VEGLLEIGDDATAAADLLLQELVNAEARLAGGPRRHPTLPCPAPIGGSPGGDGAGDPAPIGGSPGGDGAGEDDDRAALVQARVTLAVAEGGVQAAAAGARAAAPAALPPEVLAKFEGEIRITQELVRLP
jgi:hypothetical protein